MDSLPLPADLIDHIRHILHATRLQAAVRGWLVRSRFLCLAEGRADWISKWDVLEYLRGVGQ
eukprot:4105560-Prymnesium_polylepis.2